MSIKQYDRKCMKMAIIKHEETFRHQVRELHRLYRVQKLLMNEVKMADSMKKQKEAEESKTEAKTAFFHDSHGGRRRLPRRPLDLELPADEFNDESMGDEEMSDLELTLATGYRGRRKNKETSFTSDSGMSSSLNSAESAGLLKPSSLVHAMPELDEQHFMMYKEPLGMAMVGSPEGLLFSL